MTQLMLKLGGLMAAILDFKIKMRSDHKIGTTSEFLIPKDPKLHSAYIIQQYRPNC